MRGTNAARARVTVSKTIGAPVGGLNAIDALADMPPTDAVQLDNWFPRTGDVVVRNGYQSWATGFASPVETIMVYRTGSSNTMFGVAGGSIYNATGGGAIGAAVHSGLANSRIQYHNMGTPGGRFLHCVNGADYARLYDGTAWYSLGNGTGAAISSITFSGTTATVTTAIPHGLTAGPLTTVTVTGATPAAYNVTAAAATVTGANTFTYTMGSSPGANASPVGSYTYGPSVQGVDTRLWLNCDVINSRAWFVEKNSLRAWYLGLNSISGTANSIDLSSICKLGGYLVGVFSWAIGSSTGMQNLTVFVTSEGEVMVYAGYDPTNASTWALSARARIGAPVGQRFWMRVGMDVILIGRDGVVELSKAIQVDRYSDSGAVSRKILNLINNDISAYANNFGWQVQQYPLGNQIFINVPQVENKTAIQYVMNTLTGAWCRYTNLNANCFEYMSDKLYFGGATKIYRCEVGTSDDGGVITATAKQAFNYFGEAGTYKRFTAARPVCSGLSTAQIAFDINMDFEDRPSSSRPTLSLTGNPLYFPFAWPSYWTPQQTVSRQLQYASGLGFAASAKIQAITSTSPISWQSTTFMYERGGPF